MTGRTRGLMAGGLQLALVLTMVGKYAVDRATLPRVWAKAVPYDPRLPFRGRYVRLSLYAVAKGAMPENEYLPQHVELGIEKGELTATPGSSEKGVLAHRAQQGLAILNDPIAFFIPDNVPDPSIRRPGEELWAEVSVPRRGPPRPLRLGVKNPARDGSVIQPLDQLH